MNRHEIAKLGAGCCLAILFTAAVFGPMGFGRRYLDNLQHRVRADLDAHAFGQVAVAVEKEPALRRVVVLSGDMSATDRLAAMKVSRNVAGVATVRWSATGSAASIKLSDVSAQYR